MNRAFHRLLLVPAAVFAFAGCRAPEAAPPAPPGFPELRAAARRQLTEVRSREILRRMAARLAAAEEKRAELTDLIDSFPAGRDRSGGGDAGYDPRYRYGVESIAYAWLLLSRPPSLPAEEFIEPAARAEIDFEMLEKLSRLDWKRRSSSSLFSAESYHDLELELCLATGLTEAELARFDFATLPAPRDLPAAAGSPVGAEALVVALQLFDLPGRIAAAPGSVPAGEAERLIAREFALLRRLAEEHARFAADPKHFPTPADAQLAARLAEGRLIQLDALERAFRVR